MTVKAVGSWNLLPKTQILGPPFLGCKPLGLTLTRSFLTCELHGKPALLTSQGYQGTQMTTLRTFKCRTNMM